MHVKDHSVQPVRLHRLLVRQEIESIEIGRDSVTLHGSQGTVMVALESATLTSTPHWLVLRKISLTTPLRSFNLAGLPRDAIARIEAAIQEARRRREAFETLSGQTEAVLRALTSWEDLCARDAYLATSEARRWRADTPEVRMPQGGDGDLIDRLPLQDKHRLLEAITLKADPLRAAQRRNTDYARRQLTDFQEFFDAVESSPLTDQQRQAIVHDDDNALVVAGAGTGKTSCIVGKVGFILQKGWAAPEQILLLAFTAKAADEMRERVARRLGADVTVRTFHALGLEIITRATGRRPSVCAEATDQRLKAQTLKGLVADLVADGPFRQDLLAFQSSLRRAYRPAWEFKSQREYTQYLLDVEPRALDGRLLRSYEECEIANWLVTHGVAFEYERPYEVDTATADHRQYRPDFYLPDHGVYIEHWGVNRDGNAAPFMDSVRYREKMEWARALHAENGTALVETYSWEKRDGVLLTKLESKLRERGVKANPISAASALEMLNEKGRIDPLVNLVGTFLSLFKSAGRSVEELRARAEHGGDRARSERFLRLFARVSAAYEGLLRGRGEIDFDDMITQARGHVAGGSYVSPFRYILVDEFQDISTGRARLIQALRDQVRGAKLFCVGDDWQSIYRFTGSDISLTTEFERHFGPTRRTALDRTFRFNDRLAAFSSRFVHMNPAQLPKSLSTVATSVRPGVVIHSVAEGDSALAAILAEIAAEGAASVFLLSRYGFNAPAPSEVQALRGRFPRLSIRALTAHGSKGLEADYAVILGLSSGKYGFPSEIADDPVLGMVLADGEAFEAAEERRLFYVALTRARRRAYLVADAARPSSFVREVLADEAYEKVVARSGPAASNACPVCERGQIIRREGKGGVFYPCSNYPLCAHKAAVCSRCRRGRMRDGDGGEAICEACGFNARRCPECETGVLVEKRGNQSGRPFWGCSNFGNATVSCHYRESMGGRGG